MAMVPAAIRPEDADDSGPVQAVPSAAAAAWKICGWNLRNVAVREWRDREACSSPKCGPRPFVHRALSRSGGPLLLETFVAELLLLDPRQHISAAVADAAPQPEGRRSLDRNWSQEEVMGAAFRYLSPPRSRRSWPR